MKRVRGFTLIELMIVVVVIAILAMIALTSYSKQVRKSRRAEAKQSLSDLIMKQEKWRSNNTTYGTCIQVVDPVTQAGTACTSFNSSLKYYTVAVAASPTAVAYSMTATPKTSDQAKDTCGTYTVTMGSGTITRLPTTEGCW
jgi:type IV pilus assembly protein PilE